MACGSDCHSPPVTPVYGLVHPAENHGAAQSSHDGLVIWIYGTESEYLDVKNWLEPEILANDLQWTIAHATDRYALVDMLRSVTGTY